MKYPARRARTLARVVAGAVCAVSFATALSAQVVQPVPPPDPNCPQQGWAEGLPDYLKPGAAFPTKDTANIYTATGAGEVAKTHRVKTPDCRFHQWAWEAFVWATALDAEGYPRFLSLQTPEELFLPAPLPVGRRELHLALRQRHGAVGTRTEGAGAFVEADGSLLVAQNGYPIYASVHMNPLYFTTAKANMIHDGGYQRNAGKDEVFPVGAAVFKATWLRLADGEAAPAGTFVTQARVPVLGVSLTPNDSLYAAPTGQTVVVRVALLGLHVVGCTENHPEFLWSTFEHRLNSPRVPDGTTKPGPAASFPQNYTLYAANTLLANVNLSTTTASATTTAQPAVPVAVSGVSFTAPLTTVTNNVTTGTPVSLTTSITQTPRYTFNAQTQTFSPVTNVVLWNATGSETHSPNGPGNIYAINFGAQRELAKLPAAQALFANYDLIGTVWLHEGKFTVDSNQSNAVGSVNLANSTAETFVQNASGSTTPATVNNCFGCHNGKTFTDVAPMPNLTPRRIAISHVLAAGTFYAVPNEVAVQVPPGVVK